MQRDLFELLTCPVCVDSELTGSDGIVDGELICSRCEARYPVRNGVPILLPPDFDASTVHDEIDHVHGRDDGHKLRQADYFDRCVVEEFEIARPNGAPEAHRWLLAEKFRRSIAGLPDLRGAMVIDACCGSGMDAEMLARAGARVIAIDISEGCAVRARERARRCGLDYLVAVGDVERLPVRSSSADVSYVHDGLHHLTDPSIGLRELARVSRRAISINEPGEALGTAVAVRLGIALDREDAGNRVARLDARAVARELSVAGFDARSQRYLMYYKHEPGAAMRFASRPIVRDVYRGAVTAADAVFGRWGNKLQVTATRRNAA
jgi:SAM-dependent methyltransferase